MTAPAAICLVFIALIALALAIDNALHHAKGPRAARTAGGQTKTHNGRS